MYSCTGSVLVRLFDLGREPLGGRELTPELLRPDRGGRPRALRDGEGRAHRAVLRVAQLEQALGRLPGRAAAFTPAAPRAEDRGELRAQRRRLAPVRARVLAHHRDPLGARVRVERARLLGREAPDHLPQRRGVQKRLPRVAHGARGKLLDGRLHALAVAQARGEVGAQLRVGRDASRPDDDLALGQPVLPRGALAPRQSLRDRRDLDDDRGVVENWAEGAKDGLLAPLGLDERFHAQGSSCGAPHADLLAEIRLDAVEEVRHLDLQLCGGDGRLPGDGRGVWGRLFALGLRAVAQALGGPVRAGQLRFELVDGGRHLLGPLAFEAALDEPVLESLAAAPHDERHPEGVQVRLVEPERRAPQAFSLGRRLAPDDIRPGLVIDLQPFLARGQFPEAQGRGVYAPDLAGREEFGGRDRARLRRRRPLPVERARAVRPRPLARDQAPLLVVEAAQAYPARAALPRLDPPSRDRAAPAGPRLLDEDRAVLHLARAGRVRLFRRGRAPQKLRRRDGGHVQLRKQQRRDDEHRQTGRDRAGAETRERVEESRQKLQEPAPRRRHVRHDARATPGAFTPAVLFGRGFGLSVEVAGGRGLRRGLEGHERVAVD